MNSPHASITVSAGSASSRKNAFAPYSHLPDRFRARKREQRGKPLLRTLSPSQSGSEHALTRRIKNHKIRRFAAAEVAGFTLQRQRFRARSSCQIQHRGRSKDHRGRGDALHQVGIQRLFHHAETCAAAHIAAERKVDPCRYMERHGKYPAAERRITGGTMRNRRVLHSEPSKLIRARMDVMREDRLAADQCVALINVQVVAGPGKQPRDFLDLLHVLVDMRGKQRARTGREQRLAALQHRLRSRQRESRHHRISQPAVAVKLFHQRAAVTMRVFRRLVKLRAQSAVGHHEAARYAQATFCRGIEQRRSGGPKVRSENQGCGRPVGRESGDEFIRHRRGIVRVREAGFFRQRQLFQPVEQRESEATQNSHLGKMDVRIDEAGQNEGASQIVHGGVRISSGYAGIVAALNDSSVLNRQAARGEMAESAPFVKRILRRVKESGAKNLDGHWLSYDNVSGSISLVSDAKKETHWQRWLHRPQKIWLRRALFQVHLWSGIVIGLYILMISVTGSVLVYRNELYRAATPPPFISTTTGARLTDDQLKKAVLAQYPNYKIANMRRPLNPDEAVDVRIRRGDETHNRLFDVRTGRDLGDSVSTGIRLVSKLLDLHDNLLGGTTGRKVNGIGAIAVLVLAFSGIVIWWPGRKTWRRSLMLHRGVGWKRQMWHLHSMAGFWTLAFVLIFALSGIYLAFPDRVQDIADWIEPQTPENIRTRLGDQIIYWLAYLHFGRIQGIGIPCRGPGVCDQATKAVWAFFGLAPAAMFVTGAIMWWNRVLRPRFAVLRLSRIETGKTGSDQPLTDGV